MTASPPAAHRRRALRSTADPILAAVVFALFARTFLFQAFEVPSPSMEKTVLTGDRLLVNKFVYAPDQAPLSRLLPRRSVRRGDILVFRFPEDPRRSFVKRVVALPGETVSIADKRVRVDGRELIEPYAFHSDDNTWSNDPSTSEAPTSSSETTATTRATAARGARCPRVTSSVGRCSSTGPRPRRPPGEGWASSRRSARSAGLGGTACSRSSAEHADGLDGRTPPHPC
jgi:signal peptidase I